MKKDEDYIKWLSGLSTISKKRVLGVMNRLLEMGKINPQDTYIRYDSGEYQDTLGIYNDWSIVLRLGEEGILSFDEMFRDLVLPDYKRLQSAKEFIENALEVVKDNSNQSSVSGEQHKSKLTLDINNFTAKYESKQGTIKSASFTKGTSEWTILSHLAHHPHSTFTNGSLQDLLKDPRRNADDPDKKQRVIDKIKSIRNKLGKSIITSTPQGYVIECDVTIV